MTDRRGMKACCRCGRLYEVGVAGYAGLYSVDGFYSHLCYQDWSRQEERLEKLRVRRMATCRLIVECDEAIAWHERMFEAVQYLLDNWGKLGCWCEARNRWPELRGEDCDEDEG